MKICFLAAANSIHSYRWITYFANKGHDIHWMSLAPSDFEMVKNITFYYLNYSSIKIINTVSCAIAFRKRIKALQPDILHVHYVGSYGLAGLISGFHPFVVTAWGSDILLAGRTYIKGHIIRYILKKAEAITCDAVHMIEAMVRCGADREKIHRINFGIDTNKFCPNKKNNTELRRELGIGDAPVIISLRNHDPIYDVGSLIEAAPLVLRNIPNAQFIIAGTGAQTGILREMSIALGVSKSIIFTGKISNEAILRYFNTADIYVSTSLSDAGIAASTAEAMACELPVIVTDSGENREWIKNGENGFVVVQSTPSEIAEKILLLLKDDGLRKKVGKAGRDIIMKRNDYYREMEKMEAIYLRIIENAKP